MVLRQETKEWNEVPLTHGYTENSRGIGVADMAYALRTGRKHRANSDLTYHVLDIMHGFQIQPRATLFVGFKAPVKDHRHYPQAC
ncbi:MAG: hypothetical protein GX213_02590 [Clostridiaceae bacterium]|nr:hypothetical protein [Clostridiaceae bacterium]